MHKNITKQLAAAVKNKRCWFTFCTTFVVALCGMVVILRHSDVNASLSPSFSSLESIENEIYNEEFSEPDNDFIAEEFASAEEPSNLNRRKKPGKTPFPSKRATPCSTF